MNGADAVGSIRNACRKDGISLPVWRPLEDGPDPRDAYGVVALPTTYVIRNSIVIDAFLGNQMGRLKTVIEKELEK